MRQRLKPGRNVANLQAESSRAKVLCERRELVNVLEIAARKGVKMRTSLRAYVLNSLYMYISGISRSPRFYLGPG
jgi:hypothetical protein